MVYLHQPEDDHKMFLQLWISADGLRDWVEDGRWHVAEASNGPGGEWEGETWFSDLIGRIVNHLSKQMW